MSTLGFYDYLLMFVVSAQALALAYVYHPKWKAFILSLPIPFTCAVLALGQRIDATNVLGMVLLLGYVHGVRVGHQKLGAPIVLAIGAGLLGYAVVGLGMARIVPHSNAGFWWTSVTALVLATIILFQHPHRDEPGHRTSLPIWAKLPIVLLVVFGLVLAKSHLRGFMTTFPMVGVLAAYEARHSLSTISRQVPIMILSMIPMMMVSRLTQGAFGMPASLALGWVVFLCVLLPLNRSLWSEADAS